jgi:nucleotidyltransferase/DNA polymerase involved in DNA repair
MPASPRLISVFLRFIIEGMTTSRTALCLWLPTFELRLELVRSPELDATSVALLRAGEGAAGRGEVHQVSERAAAAGVRPGMRVSQAISLCPSLTLLEPDPAHYGAAMEEILGCLGEVSPILEPVEPGMIQVGMDGMERLYGSPADQVTRVLKSLLHLLPRPLVAAMRVGRAPGTFAARVAAVSARPGAPVLVDEGELLSFLEDQPVETLPLPREAIEQLHRLEIRTLGTLGHLPLPALLRHFGSAGREARALARGERIEPVRARHRPRPLRASLDLPTAIGERHALHRALDRVLDRLLAHPQRKDRALKGLRVGGHLEEGGSWQIEVTLRDAAARREPLAFPIRSRIALHPPPRALESLFVEAFDFGAPVTQGSLFERSEAGARERVDPGSDPLTTGPVGRALRQAVRELHLRLGHAPLYRVVEVDPWSRIPERRHALLSLDDR